MKLYGNFISHYQNIAEEWVHEDFILEVWKTIDNRTLVEFLEGTPENERGKVCMLEILMCAEQCENEPPAFVKNGEIDVNSLKESLRNAYKENERYQVDEFIKRNREALSQILQCVDGKWSAGMGCSLYIFLGLYLWLKVNKAIGKEDIEALKRILDSDETSYAFDQCCRQNQICICQGDILRCMGNTVSLYRNGWQPYEDTAETMIGGFCCTETLGLIAYTEDGNLCQCTPREIREKANNKKIVMASAYGKYYILLTDEGTVITNLENVQTEEWTNMVWVYMGLNSASGITRDYYRAKQANSCSEIEEYTEVKQVFTRTWNSEQRYAILRINGELHLDGGKKVEGVHTAALGSDGYFYVKENRLYRKGYDDGAEEILENIPEGFEVRELHVADGFLVYGTAERMRLKRI